MRKGIHTFITKTCVCGCGQQFRNDIIYHSHIYIWGHNGSSKGKPSPIKGVTRVPRETRVCACGCGQTFESTVGGWNSHIYIQGHYHLTKGIKYKPMSAIGKKNIGNATRIKWQNPEFIEMMCEAGKKMVILIILHLITYINYTQIYLVMPGLLVFQMKVLLQNG